MSTTEAVIVTVAVMLLLNLLGNVLLLWWISRKL